MFESKDDIKWIMLIYRLPKSKTTAKKLSVWRKLKRLSVYHIQNSVCLLPNSEKSKESLQWLAEEIKEMGGGATLWEVRGLETGEEEKIREFFLDQVNSHYREITDAVNVTEDVKKLQSLWALFCRTKQRDYFKSPMWIMTKDAFDRKAAYLSGEGDKK